MTTGWTPERRARQAELIRRWKPWQASTGPRTPDGKDKASRNAWKGGYRPAVRAEWRELRLLLEDEIRETRHMLSLVQG